ncbi:thioesterase family protein [Sedimentibacter sp. MB31-C6]|uniref:thioesterase family protein n=1 Tax=Sedimentibacter sp. MB31-C6 TaxID=3109366 RepID=UPI002DDD48CA|nr:hypothetical protein [Sedimentibacter sp. MB36-C1]WSI03999.1 hypothetical protein U8307_13515 [Sedimentibacter sp. MB36-C1]
MLKHRIIEGMSTTYEKIITPADSYISNSVTIDNLMSTPALLATIIEISWKMLDPLIPDGYLTVVRNIELNHYYPTLIGEKVSITISVEKIDNNRIYLVFSGIDNIGEFCKGKYEKAIIKNDKLIEAAVKRAKI